MGQKEKARAIVNEKYQFTMATTMSDEQWLEAARQAAEASSSKIFGKVKETQTGKTEDGATAAAYSIANLGGAKMLMDFTIVGRPNQQGQNEVSLMVGFILIKGAPIPGLTPTIEASRAMNKFVPAFKAALTAG